MNKPNYQQEAKLILSQLSDKVQLFLAPVLLSILPIILSVFATARLVAMFNFVQYAILTQSNGDTDLPTPPVFSQFFTNFLPFIASLALIFFTASVSLTMLKVIRGQQKIVGYSDTMLASNGQFLGNFVLVEILKKILLILWSIPYAIGYFLTIIPIIGFIFVALVQFFYSQEGLDYQTSMDPDFLQAWQVIAPIFMGMLLVGIPLLIAGAILIGIKKISYSMTSYALYDQLAEGRYLGPLQVISESKVAMIGHKMDYFKSISLIFWLWGLLKWMTLGLIYIYIYPQRITTEAIFYNYIKGGKSWLENEASASNKTTTPFTEIDLNKQDASSAIETN